MGSSLAIGVAGVAGVGVEGGGFGAGPAVLIVEAGPITVKTDTIVYIFGFTGGGDNVGSTDFDATDVDATGVGDPAGVEATPLVVVSVSVPIKVEHCFKSLPEKVLDTIGWALK